jgi:Transposase DDE domain
MSKAAQQLINEKDLQRWSLVEAFRLELATVLEQRGGLDADDTWADPRRKLELGDYFGLHLFGLFNPVVKTLRGLAGASHLRRVQQEVCSRAISLGSLSEAQAVVNLELLEAVFARLYDRARVSNGRFKGNEVVIDSTVWKVLPRMIWAFWRTQGTGQNAVRLHIEFDLAKGQVARAGLTTAKLCEQAWWRTHARPGALYVGDRNYGGNYALLLELMEKGVDWVVRLQGDTRWVLEAEEPLSAADREARVIWAGRVRLGVKGDGPLARVVKVQGEEEIILIATNLGAEQAPPDLVAGLYQNRWQVELFFRWLKCILGCRHWLAESPKGVAMQCYLALIAAQLLVLYTGQRPSKRQMELIQFYLMGWASLEELTRSVTPSLKKS